MRAPRLEDALEKVSRVITDRYGLRLICEGNRCRTDGKTIYLPSLPDDVPDALLDAIRGWADHECAHAIYTQTGLGPAFQKEHGPGAFAILNALEDARVERLMGRRYPGARINLKEAFRFVGQKAEQGRLQKRGKLEDFTAALYTRASGRPDQGWIATEAYALADACADELSALRSCRSTRRVAEIALRVWEKVRDAFETEQSPQQQPEKEQPQPSPDPQPEDDPDENGQSDASPHAPEARQAQAGARTAMAGAQPRGSAPMEMLGRLIEKELERRSSSRRDSYRVYTTRNDVVEVPKAKKGFDYRQELAALRPCISALRRRLLQTLMGRKESLWLGDRARGRLDPRSLHRLAAGRSARVFRKRVEIEAEKAACTLLLDISSSMGGPPVQLCRRLALVFAEALDVLGFPTEIIGFSTLDDDVRAKAAGDGHLQPFCACHSRAAS